MSDSPSLRRHVRVLAAVAVAALALSACSASISASPVPLPDGAFLVDVRTPQEFAEGHLEGAVNIPVELPSFAAQVGSLPVDGVFLVYCRSGRRADVAIDYMESLGMSAVNLGSLQSASDATGRRVVR